MKNKGPRDNSICRNRQAAFRYQILEKIECGIVLRGSEVKSLRAHRASLDESFARIQDGELWLYGFHIAQYDPAGDRNHDPLRVRKLLVKRGELRRLTPKCLQRGLTLVPTRAYFSERGLVKIGLALARGKSRHDKRQSLKEREHKREMDRAMRRR